MPPDKGQGTIPLEDMRSRTNGHAVLRKERKPTNKSADKGDADDKAKDGKKEADKNDDKARESEEPQEGVAIEEDMLGLSTDEATESIDPELVPERRYNLSTTPFLTGPGSDDEFEMTLPGSLYASTESFTTMESESFTPRRRLSDDAEHRDELQELAQLRQLQATIARLTAEKESAERDAATAIEQVGELKHLLTSDMEEIAKDAESLGQEIRRLKEENHVLRDELNDAQSHIFSLQPYRKDLTPEEVGRVCLELHHPSLTHLLTYSKAIR